MALTYKQIKNIASSQNQEENYNITTTYDWEDGIVIASRFITSKLYTLTFHDIHTAAHLAKLTNNITSLTEQSFKLLAGGDD